MRALFDDLEAWLLYSLPEAKNLVRWFQIGRARGRETSSSNPSLNTVVSPRLAANDAHRVVDRVLERFAQRQRAFGWAVGDAGRARGMNGILQSAGFETASAARVMQCALDHAPARKSAAVKLVAVTPALLDDAIATTAAAYGIPTPMAEIIARCHLGATGARCTSYLAYLDEPLPVGIGTMVEIPNTPWILLASAATRPSHRGRGVYSSLLTHRMRVARSRGRATALVHAAEESSAPICATFGFSEVAAIELAAWRPPQQAATGG